MPRRLFLLAALLFCFSTLSFSQVATGTYALGTFDNLNPDTINVGNLNLIVDVPVIHKPGRAGTNFNYDLVYNGSIWTPGSTWTPDQNWGWLAQTATVTGYLSEVRVKGTCTNGSQAAQEASPDMQPPPLPTSTLSNVVYYDATGGIHRWPGRIVVNACTGGSDTLSNTRSIDGKYLIGLGGSPITDLHGHVINPPVGNISGGGTYTDANGNEITTDGSGNFTDTTGKVALAVAGSAPSNQTYTYTDASGTSRAVTFSYKTYSIATKFGCSNISEYTNASTSLVDTITMPDSSTYQFTYEPTPGVSGSVTGRLQTMKVPSGGTITYGYTGANNGINCADGSALGLTRKLTSSSNTPTRTYTRTISSAANSHTQVVDGLGNYLQYDFVKGQNTATTPSEVFQTAFSVTNGNSGTALLAQQTCYNAASVPCTTQSLTMPIMQVNQYETWDGVTQNGSTAIYDAYGEVTSYSTLDFGTATAPGSTLQTEVITYSNGLLSTDKISDSSGVFRSTAYTYDGAALQSTSGIPQRNTSVGSHGNLTQIQYIDPAGAIPTISHNYQYYDTGSLYEDITLQGGTTKYSYESTNTFPNLVTPADPNSVGLKGTPEYELNLGTLTSVTDSNGTVASVVSSNAYGRPTEVDVNQAGTTIVSKTKQTLTPTQSSFLSYQSNTVSEESDTYYDAYGRTIRSATKTEAGWYVSDVCYDANGRVSFQSYPYSATTLGAEVCSGSGDSTTYDALGRVKLITHHDSGNSTVSYAYTGAAAKQTDENGVSRIYQTDGLGRQSIVCELTTTALAGVSPTTCGTMITGTGFVTSYSYSKGNTTVTQGAQTRIFAYDALGRFLSKKEPEIPGNGGGAATTYAYSSNSTGQVVTRTTQTANQTNLALTTTATTQYDLLGRPLSVTYSDGTPTKTFTYDAALSGSSFSVGYAKGLMTAASTGTSGATMQFQYDALGRVTSTLQCIPGWCSTPAKNMTRNYFYDWAGDETEEQYSTPSAGLISLNYGVNLAGQINSVTGGQDSSLTSLYVATSGQLTPYGPTGATLGNGVTATLSYDVFGRQSGLGLMKGSTALYAYTATWQGQQVANSTDSINGTGTYGYDGFHRLQTAAIGSSAGTLNMTWGYDQYGNRLSQTATGNYISGITQPTFTVKNTTNQITSAGYQYDAAGNLRTDGVNTYTYDAEGNTTAVSGGTTASYTYDALNNRVLTTINGTTRAYGFNASGQRATVWDGSGNLLSAQYYMNGAPLAYWLASDGHVRFEHQDWVGTQRFRTTYSGGVEGSFTSLPFGDSQATASGADTDPAHFGTLDTDTTDIKHAIARQYSSIQGRWVRPDPYDGSYDLSNPQSLNRYSYVLNSPLLYVDPTGECHTGPDGRQVEDGGLPCGGYDGTTVTADGNDPVIDDPGIYYAPGGGGFCASCFGGGGSGGNSGVAPSSLSPAQCAAISKVIAREAQYGTSAAAKMSSNTFTSGDGTMLPFDSSLFPNVQTTMGPIDLDWFTDLSAHGGGQYTYAYVYVGAKIAWTVGRKLTGKPIGNALPFSDSGETNAVKQLTVGTRYADLFPQAYLKRVCGG